MDAFDFRETCPMNDSLNKQIVYFANWALDLSTREGKLTEKVENLNKFKQNLINEGVSSACAQTLLADDFAKIHADKDALMSESERCMNNYKQINKQFTTFIDYLTHNHKVPPHSLREGLL